MDVTQQSFCNVIKSHQILLNKREEADQTIFYVAVDKHSVHLSYLRSNEQLDKILGEMPKRFLLSAVYLKDKRN